MSNTRKLIDDLTIKLSGLGAASYACIAEVVIGLGYRKPEEGCNCHETFMDKCINGGAVPADFGEYVGRWLAGEGSSNLQLCNYLGLSEEEYRLWHGDSRLASSIIEARIKGVPISEYLELP